MEIKYSELTFEQPSWERKWAIGLLDDRGYVFGGHNNIAKCRSYLDDEIWKIKLGINTQTLPEDAYVCVVYCPFPHEKIALYKLNKLEKQYSIKETEIFYLKSNNYFVFVGDKIWHSEVWKSSLYTNYIKTLFVEDDYIKERDENERMLWELITRDNGEILQDTVNDNHSNSGFISLLDGYNLNSKIIKEWENENKKAA